MPGLANISSSVAVTTADDTPTTALSFSLPVRSAGTAQIRVVASHARRHDTKCWHLVVGFKRLDNGIALVGVVTPLVTALVDAGAATWAVDCVVKREVVDVQCTGQADALIDWHVWVEGMTVQADDV